jgi:hypothetical protein
MKRVSLVAMAAVPGLAGGLFAVAGPAAAEPIPRSHRVTPDTAASCTVYNLLPYNCVEVYGQSVHVSALRLYHWSKPGTGYVEYRSPGGAADSKWRAHTFAHNSGSLYYYYWGGIHCSFPAGTHIFGWANYQGVKRSDYVDIEGSLFNKTHTCI